MKNIPRVNPFQPYIPFLYPMKKFSVGIETEFWHEMGEGFSKNLGTFKSILKFSGVKERDQWPETGSPRTGRQLEVFLQKTKYLLISISTTKESHIIQS